MISKEASFQILIEISVNHLGVTIRSFDEYEMPEFEMNSQNFQILDVIQSGSIPEEIRLMMKKEAKRKISYL
jgi:hypothetical protein